LKGLLAKWHVVVIVALAEGEVVVGLVAYDLDKLERARREYDIMILPSAQNIDDIASRLP